MNDDLLLCRVKERLADPLPLAADDDGGCAEICLAQVSRVGRHGRGEKRNTRFSAGGDGRFARQVLRLRAEHRAHGGADRLGVIRVGAAVQQDDRHLQRVRGAEDRAEIAGVLNAVQQKRAGRQPGFRFRRQAAQEDRPLRRVHEGHGLHDVLRHTDNADVVREFT